MDEETIQKITLGLCIGILIMSYLVLQGFYLAKNEIAQQNRCGEIVDIIYEQCNEERHINLTTIKGRSKTLEYRDGVCIIK